MIIIFNTYLFIFKSDHLDYINLIKILFFKKPDDGRGNIPNF